MPREVRKTFSEHLEGLEDGIDSPKRVVVDGVDATVRTADEMIKLAQFTRSSRLMKYGLGACVLQQAVPPNALGSNSCTYSS